MIKYLSNYRNVEANLIVICPCLPFLRQFMRRHAPAWITQVSSTAQSYFKDYSSGTVSRSRRKNGLTRLQDDINLAENPGSSHSEARIVKEVEWRITEEPRYESHYGTTTTSHHTQDISHAIWKRSVFKQLFSYRTFHVTMRISATAFGWLWRSDESLKIRHLERRIWPHNWDAWLA